MTAETSERVLFLPAETGGDIGEAMAKLAAALPSRGADLADVVKIVVTHRAETGPDEARLLAEIAAALPAGDGVAVSLLAPPRHDPTDTAVSLRAVALRDASGARLPRTAARLEPLPSPLAHAVRCGRMIFTAGVDAREPDGGVAAPGDLIAQSRTTLERIGALLGQFGARHDDAVKINTSYTGGGRFEDWREAALTRARFFAEPGPAATGIPLPRFADPALRTRIELVAMLGTDGARLPRRHVWPDGHWDWPIHLPYKHGVECGGLICIGGQVALTEQGAVIAPGDLVAQTRIAVEYIRRVLAGFGADLRDVVELVAHHERAAPADLAAAIAALAEAGAPVPAAWIAYPYLAYEQMVVEIDTIARLGAGAA